MDSGETPRLLALIFSILQLGCAIVLIALVIRYARDRRSAPRRRHVFIGAIIFTGVLVANQLIR